MVKYILLIPILLFTCRVYTQNVSVFSCDSLIKPDSFKMFASGNLDHNEIQIDWIQDEVSTNNFSKWSKRWVRASFYTNDKIIDSLQYQLYEDQGDRLIRIWRRIQNDLEEDDRVYYYTTPKRHWEALAGQDGLVVIKNCVIMSKVILLQS